MRLTHLSTHRLGEPVLNKVTYTNTGSEPVSTSDVKTWAKIDFSDDDTLIGSLISEVIDMVENQMNLTIVDKTVTAVYEQWAASLQLPFAPVSSITSVKEIDTDGTKTDVDSADYLLSGDILYLNDVKRWSDPFNQLKLEIVYDSAWGTLPEGIKLGLKKAILSNYEDRQDLAGGMSVVELPNSSKAILKRFKNY